MGAVMRLSFVSRILGVTIAASAFTHSANSQGYIYNNGSYTALKAFQLGATTGFVEEDGKFTTIAFPGAEFTDSFGINNRGQIVGNYVPGSSVPELSTWAMLLIGFAGLCLTRRRKISWISAVASLFVLAGNTSSNASIFELPEAGTVQVYGDYQQGVPVFLSFSLQDNTPYIPPNFNGGPTFHTQ
jgi:hypothetical protein